MSNSAGHCMSLKCHVWPAKTTRKVIPSRTINVTVREKLAQCLRACVCVCSVGVKTIVSVPNTFSFDTRKKLCCVRFFCRGLFPCIECSDHERFSKLYNMFHLNDGI